MSVLRRWWDDVPATTLFTASLLVVFVITAVESLSVLHNLSGSALGDAWRLYGPEVSQGGVDRLRALGAVFLHVDAGHVAVNSFLLLLIGREIERFTGSALFVAVFLAGGVGASAAVLWMDWGTPTVGASGVVFALMVLLVGLTQARGGDLRAPLTLIGVNVAYTVIAPNVSFWGHMGGLFLGLLMVWFVVQPRVWMRWTGVLGVLGLSCVAVALV